jgi:hypothetical protein
MRRSITETRTAHQGMTTIANGARADYFRFDVPPSDGVPPGLSGTKLDECKKRKRKSRDDLHSENPSIVETFKGGYTPHKYVYETSDSLRDRAKDYCNDKVPDGAGIIIAHEIDRCARILCEYSRRRQENNYERWLSFVTDPDECVGLNQSLSIAS